VDTAELVSSIGQLYLTMTLRTGIVS